MATVVKEIIDESGPFVATLGSSVQNAAAPLLTNEKLKIDLAWFALSLLSLWVMRVFLLRFLVLLSRSQLADRLRITRKPAITGTQIERESVWKYGYFYDTVALFTIYYFGFFREMPFFDWKALAVMFALHATIVEFVYYWFHRALHWSWLYKNYHQYHHKSIATEPTTALSFEIAERLSYTLLFAVAPIGSAFLGFQSTGSLMLYMLLFDILNEVGHINFEVMPDWYHNSFLKYIIYTPSFHAVHHTKFKKNFSLFMPWTDILFGSAIYNFVNEDSLLPTKAEQQPCDFLLLVHGGYVSSVLYSKFVHPFTFIGAMFTKICRNKYEHEAWMFLAYPYLFLLLLYISLFESLGHHVEELFDFTPLYENDGKRRTRFKGTTWILHNLAAQFLIPQFQNLINTRIEQACLQAKKDKVRVVVLGNFNKAEWMNHGGSDIVRKLGDELKGTYISHGDTLSAAVIYQYALQLKEKGYWRQGVFVTGATSKIGRAVVLSLVRHGIGVKMFTQCKARYDEIAAEVQDAAQRSCLRYTSSLKEGSDCDLWLTGKMIPYGRELLDAIPQHATIVNFSVPDPLNQKLLSTRPDLLHLDSGLLAYDRSVMSPSFTWLLPDGHIYACLAGGIVHSVLGIAEHEVGPVDVEAMTVYWEAALQIGFRIPAPSSFYNPVTMPPPRSMYQNNLLTV